MSRKYKLAQEYKTPKFTFPKGMPIAYINGKYVIGNETFSDEEMVNTFWFEEIKEEQLPSNKERIEVTLSKYFIDPSDNWTAHLYSTKPITKDKFPAIKQAIEKVLNGEDKDNRYNRAAYERLFDMHQRLLDDYSVLVLQQISQNNPAPTEPSLSTDKDWEITQFITKKEPYRYHSETHVNGFNKFGATGFWRNDIDKYLADTEWEIHQVKRISDNQVFTIGDTVEWNLPEHTGSKPFEITSFQINEILPEKRMFCNNGNIDIFYLKKSTPHLMSAKVI